MTSRRRIAAFIAGAIFLSAPAAWAEEELKNDSFMAGDMVAFQQGFVTGEIGASRFTPPLPDMTLVKVQFILGGGTTTEKKTITLHVWDDAARTDDPGTSLHSADYELTPDDMALQEIDLTADNVTLTGPFRVGVEFHHDGLPSIARDTDGTVETDGNFIYAQGGTWKNATAFGVNGDWIIRAFVDGGTVDAGTSSGTTTTSSSAAGSTSGAGAGGPGGVGGAGGGGGASGGAGSGESDEGGCGCRAAGSDSSAPAALIALLVAGAATGVRRRRR